VNSTRDIAARLAQEHVEARHLQEIWQSRESIPWLHESTLARRFIERAMEAGELLLACDTVAEASRLHADPGLRHDQARALLRLGSYDDALAAIRAVADERGLTDRMRFRTLLIKGDIHFEEAAAQTARENHEAQLHAARDAYRAALALSPEDHDAAAKLAVAQLLLARCQLPGDSCASTTEAATAAAGFERQAGEVARRALALVEARLDKCERVDEQFKLVVARAEARCILGDFDEAAVDYRAAARLESIPAHRLAAARKRARLIAGAKRALSPREETRESFFDGCFPPLQLIVFSGHMPDMPGASRPRFPPSAEETVRQRIRATLEELKASVGFASAAAGGDLLFLEEMRRRDAQVHVVLPWAREAFVTTSVARAGRHWVERFDRALAEAASVRMLGELNQPTDRVGYQYANAVMMGLARLTARALGLDLVPLALWDERPGDPGGTADFVASWQSQGLVPTIISLPPVEARAPVAPSASSAAASTKPAHEQQVRAMLFADIVGYSRLPEAVIPDFAREFMGGVSRVIAESAHGPISVNTWGDALYFVFDRVESAGRFALELVELIEQTAWEDRGVFWEDVADGRIVRRPLRLRTALHAGPVFWHFDPVVRQLTFTGAHVSRAARIEPVTAPGEVFASEEFAALAAAQSATGFACHFVGTMPLAKKYPGVFRIYRLRRVQSFPVDQLGRLIHEAYCRERAAVGETPAKNAALRAWDDLPADLQTANREQAADIPAKLRAIGYELVTAPRGLTTAGARPPDDPDFLAAVRDHEERLAIGEHERWSRSRLRAGWLPGPRDDTARRHPNLVPWEELDEAARDKDREAVRGIPFLLARAGFRVRRL